jgi:hypothetical protein
MDIQALIALPRPEPTALALEHAHPRDKDISFQEEGHIYTILGEVGTYTSVTTVLKAFDEPFDEEMQIDRLLRKTHAPGTKYFEKSYRDIKQMWEENRNSASTLGSFLHYTIERYLNKDPFPHIPLPEYGYFLQFLKDYPHLKPIRTEWRIYHEEAKICGTIDAVMMDTRTGDWYIYDWKRSKPFNEENTYRKFFQDGIAEGYPKTTFFKYSLQLNLYEWILREKYGRTIAGRVLVRCHPDSDTYEHVIVPSHQDLITQIVQDRSCKIL